MTAAEFGELVKLYEAKSRPTRIVFSPEALPWFRLSKAGNVKAQRERWDSCRDVMCDMLAWMNSLGEDAYLLDLLEGARCGSLGARKGK